MEINKVDIGRNPSGDVAEAPELVQQAIARANSG